MRFCARASPPPVAPTSFPRGSLRRAPLGALPDTANPPRSRIRARTAIYEDFRDASAMAPRASRTEFRTFFATRTSDTISAPLPYAHRAFRRSRKRSRWRCALRAAGGRARRDGGSATRRAVAQCCGNWEVAAARARVCNVSSRAGVDPERVCGVLGASLESFRAPWSDLGVIQGGREAVKE